MAKLFARLDESLCRLWPAISNGPSYFDLTREYWTLYRGQSFLAFLRSYDSAPCHPSPSSTGDTEEEWVWETTCSRWRERGRRRWTWSRIRGSKRDVVNLGWPIAPSYMSPNAWWGEGVSRSQPMSTVVHMEPKYTLEISVSSYLTYEPSQKAWPSIIHSLFSVSHSLCKPFEESLQNSPAIE